MSYCVNIAMEGYGLQKETMVSKYAIMYMNIE